MFVRSRRHVARRKVAYCMPQVTAPRMPHREKTEGLLNGKPPRLSAHHSRETPPPYSSPEPFRDPLLAWAHKSMGSCFPLRCSVAHSKRRDSLLCLCQSFPCLLQEAAGYRPDRLRGCRFRIRKRWSFRLLVGVLWLSICFKHGDQKHTSKFYASFGCQPRAMYWKADKHSKECNHFLQLPAVRHFGKSASFSSAYGISSPNVKNWLEVSCNPHRVT